MRRCLLLAIALSAILGLVAPGTTDSGAVPLAGQVAPPAGPPAGAPRPGQWPLNRQELRQQWFDHLNRDTSGQLRPDLLQRGVTAQLRMPIATGVRPRSTAAE